MKKWLAWACLSIAVLTMLGVTESTARGCNKPYRTCSGAGIRHSCVWHDDTSCGHCPKDMCTAHAGCKWQGLFQKNCGADFSTGRDALIN